MFLLVRELPPDMGKYGHCQKSNWCDNTTTDPSLSLPQTTSIYKLMASLAYKWLYVNGCTMDSRDSSGIQPLQPCNTLTRLSDRLRHLLAFFPASLTSVSTCPYVCKLNICPCLVPPHSPSCFPCFPPVPVCPLFHSQTYWADFICTDSPFESVAVASRAVILVSSGAAFGESENFRSVTPLTEIHTAHIRLAFHIFSPSVQPQYLVTLHLVSLQFFVSDTCNWRSVLYVLAFLFPCCISVHLLVFGHVSASCSSPFCKFQIFASVMPVT